MLDKGRTASKIATIADRQYGHVTRAQLLALGMPARTITRRVKSQDLVVVHAGVYAVGHAEVSPVAKAAGAVLACGQGAALSHGSAAALWGLRRWPAHPEVSAPVQRRVPGIRSHRRCTLARRDIRHQLGIRVTSPARTVLDIAPGLDDPSLARAVNDARLHCGLHPAHLIELLDRLPHHTAAGRVRAEVQTPQAPTRSRFEDTFLAFAQRYGLPTPRVNVMIAGHLVDAVFPAERVIVELDGYDFHQGKRSFESDRERDADTLAAGFVTIRITWDRLTLRGSREATRLRAILDARRSQA
ncbi:MAG: type IV toxin-antitoxin system AbiEi family antitoxin domain-containing protein [Solirubrobacteraceae bacterium]